MPPPGACGFFGLIADALKAGEGGPHLADSGVNITRGGKLVSCSDTRPITIPPSTNGGSPAAAMLATTSDEIAATSCVIPGTGYQPRLADVAPLDKSTTDVETKFGC